MNYHNREYHGKLCQGSLVFWNVLLWVQLFLLRCPELVTRQSTRDEPRHTVSRVSTHTAHTHSLVGFKELVVL